jgi:hypothetical protein
MQPTSNQALAALMQEDCHVAPTLASTCHTTIANLNGRIVHKAQGAASAAQGLKEAVITDVLKVCSLLARQPYSEQINLCPSPEEDPNELCLIQCFA